MLFSVILLLSVIQNILDVLVKLTVLLVKKLMAKTSTFNDFKRLQAELQQLCKMQQETSAMDEFAKHARLQRKIENVKDQIAHMSSQMTKRVVYFQTALYWILRATIALCFICIAFMYRYESVIAVDKNIFPFHFLALIVAFPTGEPGKVGCLFWLFLCQISVRRLVQYIKSRL